MAEDLGAGRVLLIYREHIGKPEELSSSEIEIVNRIARDGQDFQPRPPSADAAVLVARLDSVDPELLWSAIRELTRKRPPEAFEALVAMLESDNEQARRNAALMLGEIGDQRAVPILSRCVASWNQKDATSALAALANLERQANRPSNAGN